jgi:chromosome segregation ATPase
VATIRTTARKTDDTAKVGAGVKVPLAEVRKPIYAYLGAADAAVEKILTLPVVTAEEVKKLSGRVNEVSTQAQKLPNNVSTVVKSLPTTVTSQLADLQQRASSLYNAFADRGEKRVSTIRKSPATEEAVARTKTAVSQTKAARTSTRRAVASVGKAASDAAPTG